jgi:hypothetical protein
VTARVWDVDELDRVHPLPEGWRWTYDHDVDDGLWHAEHEDGRRFVSAYVAATGDVYVEVFPSGKAPRAVVDAVILASQGWDSFEHIARHFDGVAKFHKGVADDYGWSGDRDGASRERERQGKAESVAEMLRRGRVEP